MEKRSRMDDFIKNQLQYNKDIDARIQKMESDTLDHGKRLNVLEKEINTMSLKFERMIDNVERIHAKLDIHSEGINELRVQLPTLMNDFLEKNAKQTETIVNTHQLKCSRDMESKFLALPDGWKGYLIRGIVILLGALFGLDISGVMPIVSKPEQKHEQVILKDQSGHTYYLQEQIATDSHK